MKYIQLFTLVLLIGISANAQDITNLSPQSEAYIEVGELEKEGLETCEDLVQNDDELRIDCGGAGCPDCLQLAYDIECFDDGGYQFRLRLPDDIGYPLVIDGDMNFPEYYPFLEGYELIAGYDDGSTVFVRVKEYNEDGDLLSVGIISDPTLSCIKLSDEYECPGDSELEVDAQMVLCDQAEGTFYIELNITNGLQFYQLVDNNTEYYFDANFDDTNVFLGPFSDGYPLDFTFIDSDGCEVKFDWEYDLASCELTIDNVGIEHIEDGSAELLVYPTVSSDFFNITYELEQSAVASIRLYNILGVELDLIINNEKSLPGKHTYQYDASSLPNGTYFYLLEVDGRVAKSLVIKE